MPGGASEFLPEETEDDEDDLPPLDSNLLPPVLHQVFEVRDSFVLVADSRDQLRVRSSAPPSTPAASSTSDASSQSASSTTLSRHRSSRLAFPLRFHMPGDPRRPTFLAAFTVAARAWRSVRRDIRSQSRMRRFRIWPSLTSRRSTGPLSSPARPPSRQPSACTSFR